jgi:hypothetical protein
MANSSSDNWILTAPSFSFKCATSKVPEMGSMTGLRLRSRATTLAQLRQQNDLPIGKFESVMMSVKPDLSC